MNFNLPSPIQEIQDFASPNDSIKLFLKREDLIHPYVSGNKWRKLKFNVLNAQKLSKTKIISFGGAFSNHLHACAALCNELQVRLECIVRADSIDPSNPTLNYIKSMGAEIRIMNRKDYRRRNEMSFLEQFQTENPEAYIIPEGGTNLLALQGVGEMVAEIENQIEAKINQVFVPVGSGGTISGIINKINPTIKVVGIAALKDYSLTDKVSQLLHDNHCTNSNWTISFDDCFGGFAKFNDTLIDFTNNFYKKYDIQLDPIYTSKMMFAIDKRIKNSEFEDGTNIMAIHTGGLQGIEAFNYINGKRLL
jgi:1-aminocyclopropane-1-carboxylate deaminase